MEIQPECHDCLRRLVELTVAQAAVDRYFESFESGTLKAELCNEKVGDLNARLVELKTEKQDLELRRARMELPSIDQMMLTLIVDNFDQLIAAGSNQQKKHLLRQIVKKVLVHDRNMIEVWYALLPPSSAHTPGCSTAKTSIQRHYGLLSPAEIDDLVEGAADLVVAFLQRKRDLTKSTTGRQEQGNGIDAIDISQGAG